MKAKRERLSERALKLIAKAHGTSHVAFIATNASESDFGGKPVPKGKRAIQLKDTVVGGTGPLPVTIVTKGLECVKSDDFAKYSKNLIGNLFGKEFKDGVNTAHAELVNDEVAKARKTIKK